MSTIEALRKSVRASLPEIDQIKDENLGEKVVEAWALSLSKSEFTAIEQIPASGVPGSPMLKNRSQVDHIRAVGQMAQALVDSLEKVHGNLGIDHDILWACALCHDVGKPFEFSPSNQQRWQSNVAASGYPAIRHSVYGAHIALTVGLPEAVAHCAGAHSAEGELIQRSLENTVVHYADDAYWAILERAGQVEKR